MIERNPDIRRLRSMRREVGFILGAILATVIIQNTTLTFSVLCLNAFMWAIMFQQVSRDLSELAVARVEKPTRRHPMK